MRSVAIHSGLSRRFRPFPPSSLHLAIYSQSEMLALLSAAASAAPRAQSVSRASLDPDASTVCISTAVHTKTAQCNLDCNTRGRQCPKECLCSPAKDSLELSFGMPSDSFASLVNLAAHGAGSTHNASAYKLTSLRRKTSDVHHRVAYNGGQMAVSKARARLTRLEHRKSSTSRPRALARTLTP